MIAFRKGDVDKGLSLYINAIEKSRDRTDYPELNYSALLNFCREILIYENSTENKNYVLSIMEKLPQDDKNKELVNLREQVTALLNNECE